MKRLLVYVSVFTFVLFAYLSVVSSNVYAEPTCCQYDPCCSSNCSDYSYGSCNPPTNTPRPPTSPPNPTSNPTSAPGTCGGVTCPFGTQCVSGVCKNVSCNQCPEAPCTCPPGQTPACNKSTCHCGCVGTNSSCTSWSGWGGCIDGTQTRNCMAPPGVNGSQQQSCSPNPTGPGGPGGPTDTPVPPAPTATPFIRVRAFNPELTPVVVSSTLCKASCNSSPCTFANCNSNVNMIDVGGAVSANQGGSLQDSSIVVLGVTPVTNGTVDASGTYSANCRGAGTGNHCYYWPSTISTGSRVVRYVVATPTNTPTPTPGPWVKLKDTSYVSTSGLNNRIPLAPVAYDASDTNQAYFIVGEAGVCMAPSIDLTAVNSNAKSGNPEYQALYTPAPYSMTSASFSGYIKARKEYTTITSLNEIDSNGIYMIDGNLNLSSVPAQFDQYNVVILVSGAITIDAASFTPTKSIALISETLDMTTTVTQARGIFIADNVSLGTTTNQGIKITGNLISQSSLANSRKWGNPNIPSLYIAFDPAIYLDILPYLSTANYEWKQLQ